MFENKSLTQLGFPANCTTNTSFFLQLKMYCRASQTPHSEVPMLTIVRPSYGYVIICSVFRCAWCFFSHGLKLVEPVAKIIREWTDWIKSTAVSRTPDIGEIVRPTSIGVMMFNLDSRAIETNNRLAIAYRVNISPALCDTSKHLTALCTTDTGPTISLRATPYSTAPMLGGALPPFNQSWGGTCPCCPPPPASRASEYIVNNNNNNNH